MRVGCFVHALNIIPKGVSTESTYAHQALEYFKKLFMLESRWTEIRANERYEKRLEESKPVLKAYLAWLKKHNPKLLERAS